MCGNRRGKNGKSRWHCGSLEGGSGGGGRSVSRPAESAEQKMAKSDGIAEALGGGRFWGSGSRPAESTRQKNGKSDGVAEVW